jgi:TPR repeat protein
LLGESYNKGQCLGVPRNFAEAYFWLDLATAGKLSNAKDVATDRDEAASHLTPDELARAQERARKWFEAHQAKPQ